MARFKGIVKFTGKLGDVSAYTTQDGLIVRARSGPDKKRLKKDPAFRSVYNQSLEFGACAKAASLLRNALRPLMLNTCDNRVSSRLNQVMNAIKNLDVVSVPGKRTVDNGLNDPGAKDLLLSFNLNNKAELNKIIKTPYRVDSKKQVIDFGTFNTKKDLKSPKGATHMRIKGAHAVVDFAKRQFNTVEDTAELPLKGINKTLILNLKNTSTLKGLHVYALKISFLQEVNGLLYELDDAGWKGCEIVGVGG